VSRPGPPPPAIGPGFWGWMLFVVFLALVYGAWRLWKTSLSHSSVENEEKARLSAIEHRLASLEERVRTLEAVLKGRDSND